jgi:hypoxanthine phosphoribosyltransferase
MVELTNLERENFEVLIERKDILERVDEIAMEISEKYRDSEKDVMLLGVMSGGIMFAADIAKRIDINAPLYIDTMIIKSYGSGTESNRNPIIEYMPEDVSGKRIIIIEDIIDSGHTMRVAIEELKRRGALSVEICTLLSKESKREVDIPIDYLGFKIPNKFVLGYGLDYNNRYRNFEDIVVKND